MSSIEALKAQQAALAEQRKRLEDEEKAINDKIQRAIEERANEGKKFREELEKLQRLADEKGFEFSFKFSITKTEKDSSAPSPITKYGKKTQKAVALEIMNLKSVSGEGLKPKTIFDSEAQAYWRKELPVFQTSDPKPFDLVKERTNFTRALKILSEEGHIIHYPNTCCYALKNLKPSSSGISNSGPVVNSVEEDEDSEEELCVSEVSIQGKTYYVDENTGDIYDTDTEEKIGTFLNDELTLN